MTLKCSLFFITFCFSFFKIIEVQSYLPGIHPTAFKENDKVLIKVKNLTSRRAVSSLNYNSFPFCTATDKNLNGENVVPNIFQLLVGDTLYKTSINTQFLKNKYCAEYCKIFIDENAYNSYKHLILYNYNIIYSVDNMEIFREDTKRKGFYYSGIPVGFIKDENYYIYNYYKFRILYNTGTSKAGKTYYIVGFEVDPKSIDFGENPKCTDSEKKYVMEKNRFISFKYDIEYVESDNSYQHRSEHYYRTLNEQSMIHWFSIINSIILVILLSFILCTILIKALHKDINKYNKISANIFETDELDDKGWKLVHGDVFRKPRNSTLFSAFIGVGIQIIFMLIVCALILLIGIYKYKQRYKYIQVMFFIWIFISSISGYSSSQLYKLFKSRHVKLTMVRTLFIYPFIIFLTFFLINIVLHYEQSNSAISFLSLTFICLLWFGISAPLICIGSYIGNKKRTIELPVRVNNIPRHIPKQPWTNSFYLSSFVVGIILFGAMYTELFFLFTSLWKSNIYYLFGFLFLVIFLLGLLSGQLSVALIYYTLSCEDYNWWWKSFFAPGTSGIFFFLYSIYYYFFKLNISAFAEAFIYFAYSFIMSYTCFIYTGTVGFLASFFFLKKIYSSIKVD